MTLKITLIAIIVIALNSQTTSAQEQITLDNWLNHQDIKAVRRIYSDIQSGIKDGQLKSQSRAFNVASPECGTYPIKEEQLVLENNHVRAFKVEQIISHGEPLVIERYYDSSGVLRFVFADYPSSDVRIYLDENGDVIWAVEKSVDKTVRYESTDDDFETIPNNAVDANEKFLAKQSCPEIM